MITNSDNECPYRNNGCTCVYKWVVYCCTKKYFKCIEYQKLCKIEWNKVVEQNQEVIRNLKRSYSLYFTIY